jgi:hypothetical protein
LDRNPISIQIIPWNKSILASSIHEYKWKTKITYILLLCHSKIPIDSTSNNPNSTIRCKFSSEDKNFNSRIVIKYLGPKKSKLLSTIHANQIDQQMQER